MTNGRHMISSVKMNIKNFLSLQNGSKESAGLSSLNPWSWACFLGLIEDLL